MVPVLAGYGGSFRQPESSDEASWRLGKEYQTRQQLRLKEQRRLQSLDVLECVKDTGAFVHSGRAKFFFDPQQLVVFGQARRTGD